MALSVIQSSELIQWGRLSLRGCDIESNVNIKSSLPIPAPYTYALTICRYAELKLAALSDKKSGVIGAKMWVSLEYICRTMPMVRDVFWFIMRQFAHIFLDYFTNTRKITINQLLMNQSWRIYRYRWYQSGQLMINLQSKNKTMCMFRGVAFLPTCLNNSKKSSRNLLKTHTGPVC